MKEQILDQLNMFIWAKDTSFKYVYCNEHYAEAAGLDSPNQIIGKSDDQLPWRKLADYFKVGDYAVFQGLSRTNVEETTDANNIKDILVSETQLLDSSGKTIGLVGSFVDITGKQLVKKAGYFDKAQNRYYLGHEDFNNEYFTPREVEVFKRILLGYTAKQIGKATNLSYKTVESYISTIRLKLQASCKAEIIATAIQYGLTHIIHLHTHEIIS